MSKGSILIVEDEAIVAEDLSRKLSRLGYDVVGVTASGEESVARARERRPDLVLMDIRLEGQMDGVDAAQVIRRESDIPVIYLTAHSDSATLQRAKVTEPFGYILKPFETPQLETQIQMALYKHQTEREMHRQREWLRVTLHSIGDAVITSDAAGKVTSLNPVAEEMTGWKVAEAFNRPLTEVFNIINEETRKPAFNPVDRVLNEGKIAGLANHTALISRDGRETAIEDSAAPIKDAQGRILGVVMVFHDVTEKRRAEKALRESESRAKVARAVEVERQRFFDVLNMLPAYVVLLSADYRVPFANRFFEERFGKSIGRRCFEYLFNRTEPCENCETYKVLKTNAPHDWEWTGPDGRMYEIHDFPFNDADGSRLIMEMGIDVTERKQAETALRAERQRFYDVLETLPAMICLLTPDHRVAFANRSFREKFGEAQGRQCYEQCFGRSEPCEFCESYNVLKTGRPHHWEVKGLDGSVIDAYDFPFTDVDGSPMILEMDIDITEFRQTQAALKEANERLAERTAKLEELVGELEHFSYTITHDMRAPLRGMQGFAELMAEACAGCKEHDALGFLRRIRTSAGRMDALITDALNYSKTVRQELTLEPVDVGALLRGMLDSYPDFQSSKADIELKGEIPLVMGNEAGLTQCFSNLLDNAVKFVRPGQKPEIRIWGERVKSEIRDPKSERSPKSEVGNPVSDGERVRIWVEDKGIGVPKLMLPRVFDMFSRGHSSEAYEGTGIGLALVRKVVQRMGGRVGAESEEGKGSRFWVELKPGDPRIGQ
jgi:PAS domain S-box-containing protein